MEKIRWAEDEWLSRQVQRQLPSSAGSAEGAGWST